MTPLETLPDHDRFIEACDRHRIDAADAEALWRDLGGIEPPAPTGARQHLSRSAVATMIAGTLVLSAAGMWWISLVTSAAGAPGLLALARAWVAPARPPPSSSAGVPSPTSTPASRSWPPPT